MSSIDSKAVWPGWETVRVIGHGSFGAVYEIQRDVFRKKEKAALKVISIPQHDSDINSLRNDGYDDVTITERFKEHLEGIVDEYSLMASLKGHPNAVYCDDIKYVQHDDGIGWDIFIKMELLTALDQTLRDTDSISEKEVVKIGENISSILAFCGERNIIHRDIKPENIFVSDAGIYKLGDFGIAKTVERTTGGTKTGTYRYMAPEVYNNQPYGTKADIYSLGLTLYWLLNERRLPFLPLPPAQPTGSQEEESRRRRFSGEQFPAPAHGCDELKKIVMKACAFDPADRFQSAAELHAAFEALDPRRLGGIIPLPLPQKRTANTTSTNVSTGNFSDAAKLQSDHEANVAKTTGPFSRYNTVSDADSPETDGTVGVTGENAENKAAEAAAAAAAALAAEEARKKAEEEARIKAEEAEEARKKAEEVQKQAEQEEKKKKNALPFILIAAALLVCLLVFLLLPKNVKMPNLVNTPKDSAEQALKGAGLKNYELLYEKSESIAKGNVIKTDPVADTELSKKDKVTVTISAGDGKANIPDLAGKTRQEAEALLSEVALKADFEEAYDDKISSGSVISQEPASGTRIEEGSTVSVRLSKGPAPVNAHTLRFNANGGSVSEASRKVNEGDAYGKLPTPTRNGYAFNGWYTAASGGSKVSNSTKMGKANATIYARWTANTYTLSFNANGGSVSESSRKVTYGKTYGKLPTPTRTDYTFDGWYTAASGGTRVSDSTPVSTANTTVYAHWTKVDPTWSSWSSWSQTAVTATDRRQVQTETRWRYRDKQYTTSKSNSLSGWTLYNSTTSWSAWSNWTSYGLTPITADDYTEVATTPLFRYYCYKCKNCGARWPYWNISCPSCKSYTLQNGDWNEIWSQLPYGQGNVSHYDSIKSSTTSLGDGLKWYFGRKDIGKTAAGTVGDNAGGAVVIKTGYAKRTRTKVTTYYYWQWGSWSSWSTTQYTAGDNRQVESATFYRYRDRTN